MSSAVQVASDALVGEVPGSLAQLRRLFIFVVAIAIITIGCSSIYAWLSQDLAPLQANWWPMKLNAAVGLVVFGIGIVFLMYRQWYAALACATLVTVIGLATAAEYLFAIDLRIERWWRPLLSEPDAMPEDMALSTAALFVLAGTGLGLMTLPPSAWRARLTGLMASLTAGAAMAAIIGYISGAALADGWGAFVGISIPSAVSFLLVAVVLGSLAAQVKEQQLPDWLPWAALLAGIACTTALAAALMDELQQTPHMLVPQVVVVIGFATSFLFATSLHARQRLALQQRLLQEVLHKREEVLAERAGLAAIVESSNEAMMCADLSGRVSFWNQAAERLYGYSAAEMIGRHLIVVIPPERREEFLQIGMRVTQGEGFRGVRISGMHKDGRVLEIEVDISPVRNSEGAVVGASGIARDISERLATEQLMGRVLEAAPDAMIICNLQSRIVLVNRATEKLLGYTRQQLLGRSTYDLVPLRCQEMYRQWRERVINAPADQPGQSNELTVVRSDGTEVQVEVALNLLKLPHSSLLVGDLRDLTGRRRVEQRLRDSLAEKELLLKEIHHRVKNNLQVVASLLALQADKSGDAKVEALLEDSRQRVLSMALVHEKLYGAGDLHRLDLGELLSGIATTLIGANPGVAVIPEFAVESVVINIEKAFPASLLVNELITNALKHAFAGRCGGKLQISVRRHGRWVCIRVADDGVGGVSEQAFLTSTTLGSTIVRNLARQLDGRLEIDSAPGRGTAFAVDFPVPDQAHA